MGDIEETMLSKRQTNANDRLFEESIGHQGDGVAINATPTRQPASQDTEFGTGSPEMDSNKRNIRNHVNGKVVKCDTDTEQADGVLLGPSEAESVPPRPRIPDGGYGWIVTAAGCYIALIAIGTIMCYGVMYVELLDYFQEGRTKTSVIGSMTMLACAFAGPLSGTLAVRFGHRPVVMVGSILATVGMAMSAFAVNIYHLYFSFGILTGLGVGMSLIPALAMVALYFDKRLSLAVGIALSGGGLSYIVFPMVSAACIRFYTWRGTMFILAAFWAQGCMCGALLRPLESRTTIKDGARKKQVPRPFMCDIGLLRTWQFWFYLLEEYLWHIDFMNFVVILPDFVVLSGHTKEKAAILLTIIGVFVIPSRLLGGLFLDRVSVSPILLLVFGIVTLGTTSLTLPFIKASFIGMAVVCSFRGILHGVLVVLLPKGLVVLFSRDKLTVMIGYVTLFTMFGQLTAPPLGGFIFDHTGDYLYAYITCAVISYVTALIPLALYLDNKKKIKRLLAEGDAEEVVELESKMGEDAPADDHKID